MSHAPRMCIWPAVTQTCGEALTDWPLWYSSAFSLIPSRTVCFCSADGEPTGLKRFTGRETGSCFCISGWKTGVSNGRGPRKMSGLSRNGSSAGSWKDSPSISLKPYIQWRIYASFKCREALKIQRFSLLTEVKYGII